VLGRQAAQVNGVPFHWFASAENSHLQGHYRIPSSSMVLPHGISISIAHDSLPHLQVKVGMDRRQDRHFSQEMWLGKINFLFLLTIK